MPRVPHTSPQTLRLFEALLTEPMAWRYGHELSKQTALASGTLYPILMRLTGQFMVETADSRITAPPAETRNLLRRRQPVQWRASGFAVSAVFAAGAGTFAGQQAQGSWGRWAASGYLLGALTLAGAR